MGVRGTLLGVLISLIGFIAHAEVLNTPITATPIVSFDLNDADRTRFGKLNFIGGLVLRSSRAKFGGVSGLRILENGTLIAVTDSGFWFHGQLQRSKQGIPAAISKGQIAPLLDGEGRPFGNKWFADAEGVTIAKEFVLVSTEQDTRVLLYRTGESLLRSKSIEIPVPSLGSRFRSNNGLEAIATFPKNHKYVGNVLVIRERPGQDEIDNQGFILSGQIKGRFSIHIDKGFAITDADFLPSGDLLILERKFTMGRGAQVRIRRIDGATIMADAKLQGEIIFEADSNQKIDNMEGISVFKGPFGKTRIGLISDDNHWPLQRTLYLEFALEN